MFGRHLRVRPFDGLTGGGGTGVRVLGVDPGLTRCGVGIVDGGPGLPSRLVEVSVVRTPSQSDVAHRLQTIAAHVEAAIDRHRPDTIAIEQVFSQHNVSTVIGVAQVTGVVAVTAARRGIPVYWYTPSEVKAAVSGNGDADKAQVTTMVTKLLRLSAPPKPADAADALALSVCHLLRSPMQTRMAAAAFAAQLGRSTGLGVGRGAGSDSAPPRRTPDGRLIRPMSGTG